MSHLLAIDYDPGSQSQSIVDFRDRAELSWLSEDVVIESVQTLPGSWIMALDGTWKMF